MLQEKVTSYALTDAERAFVMSLLENGMNMSKVARAHHFHRNAVVYHLEKVKERTGKDPRNVKDALALIGATMVVCCDQCEHSIGFQRNGETRYLCLQNMDEGARVVEADNFCKYGARRTTENGR